MMPTPRLYLPTSTTLSCWSTAGGAPFRTSFTSASLMSIACLGGDWEKAIARPKTKMQTAKIGCFMVFLLLANKMAQIALVLIADELDQVGIGNQLRMQFGFPRFRVCFRVVDGELNVHVAEVAPVDSFGQVHPVAGRIAPPRKPGLPVESVGFNHQGVAFPVTGRIAHPGRIGILGKLATVEEDLPEGVLIFIQNQNQAGGLDDLVRVERIRFGHAAR